MLASGSLLGWKRHCAFNTFDGDIDLHLFEDGWEENTFVREYRRQLQINGFETCWGGKAMKSIGRNHYMLCAGHTRHTLGVAHIDLYILERHGDAAIFNGGSDHWYWFPWMWIHPLAERPVYGVPMSILHETDEYLDYFYGPHWKDTLEEDNHGGDNGLRGKPRPNVSYRAVRSSDGTWRYEE